MNTGFEPVIIDNFGGLVTRIDRSDLPNGLSPNCVNVEFFPGGFQSRVGFVATATDASGYVNGIGSFMTAPGVRQRLYLYSNGTLKYATGDPTETQTTIDTALQNGMLMKSTTLFNRIYMAFSDGKTPLAHARQWDGTNFDPVTQDGVPTFPTLSVGAGGGTKCTAGLHYLTMVCETRNGALCQPSQANTSASFTIVNATDRYKLGTGGINTIPLGPPNTVRRRFYLTPAVVGGDATKFCTTPALWINNNTDDAGPVYFDVSDTELLAGEPLAGNVAKNLPNIPNLFPVPPVLSIGSYSNRLILMGPLNAVPRQVVPNLKDSNGNNVIIGTLLGFANGMFTGGALASGVPYGWVTPSSGGALATLPGGTVQSWQITCDGATYSASPYRGEIQNTYAGTRIAGDYVGGAAYNYRVRLKKSAGFTGNFIIGLVGVSSSTIPAASLTTDWAWYTGQLFSATSTGTLFMGVSGATTNGQTLSIDAVQVYSSAYPSLPARAYVSGRFSPEAFDLTTGVIDVNPGDGQGLRDGFEMGGSYYWVKERSLWRSQDNGLEPAYWDGPDEVSPVVGSPSIHGVGRGVRWVVICGEQGAYRFDGGDPGDPITDEIRPTWKRINWDYGHLLWCVVDAENQRVCIGVPLDSSTVVNAMLVLDYSDGWSNAMNTPGFGRKWSLWVGTAVAGFTCAARVERDSGRRVVVFGGGLSGSQGFVVRQDPTGAAIVDNFGYGNSTLTTTYETATVGAQIGRSFFGSLIVKAGGSGTMQPYTVRPGGAVVALRSGAITPAGNHDLEFKTKNPVDTQTGVRLVVGATNTTGSGQGNVRVKRIALFKKDAATSKFRGKNSPA